MEEKIIETEEMKVQTTFNTDSLDVLVDSADCTVENKEEVEDNANENE